MDIYTRIRRTIDGPIEYSKYVRRISSILRKRCPQNPSNNNDSGRAEIGTGWRSARGIQVVFACLLELALDETRIEREQLEGLRESGQIHDGRREC